MLSWEWDWFGQFRLLFWNWDRVTNLFGNKSMNYITTNGYLYGTAVYGNWIIKYSSKLFNGSNLANKNSSSCFIVNFEKCVMWHFDLIVRVYKHFFSKWCNRRKGRQLSCRNCHTFISFNGDRLRLFYWFLGQKNVWTGRIFLNKFYLKLSLWLISSKFIAIWVW